MTEFIIRLTDEQEAIIRHEKNFSRAAKVQVRVEMWRQAKAALALYDQLVTEAQAKSDE